jgi:hypothetical protein
MGILKVLNWLIEKGIAQKFNPNHAPAGSPEGGQFTSEGGDQSPKIKDTLAEVIAMHRMGDMSQRFKDATDKRLREALFGPTGHLRMPEAKQPAESEKLFRQAKELRDLAARGMKPRAYLKQAEILEKKAKEIQLATS